jgi:signal peptide peptidase SppA
MNGEFWLGTESSRDNYLTKLESIKTKLLTGLYLPSAYEQETQQVDTEDYPLDTLTELVDNVAIISINGDLVNEDNWYNAYEGLVSYSEISRNLIAAAQHPSCQSIILNIGSGGGTPNGLIDCMKLIEYVNSIIPVYAYTGSAMCSAAYFLPLPCTALYAGEMATTGSIGVITVHTEITKMLEAGGVKKTTVRSGVLKAVGHNPYEKLTPEAKQVLQEQSDYLMGIFTEKVATYRNRPLAYVQEFMANGGTFIGKQGLDVGIIDGVTTFDGLITNLQSKISKQQERNMAAKTPRTAPAMSLEQKAAILSLGVVAIVEGEVAELEPEVEVEVEVEVQLAAKVEVPAAPLSNDLVVYLQSQLKEAQDKITTLSAELSTTKMQLTGIEGVREIALGRVKLMGIALNSFTPVDNLDNAALFATFKALEPTFNTRYTAGQKSLSAEIDEPGKSKPKTTQTFSKEDAKLSKI